MTQFASPVLHSLLDTDAYKLHMQQAVFHHYYDVHVAAEFRCRGDDLLGIYADAIREQIQAMQHLRLQDDEYQWLSALPFFKADYLNWLREFRFNPEQVTVSNDNGKLDIRLSGPWREVILWKFLCWRLSVKWYIAIAHRRPTLRKPSTRWKAN